MVPDFSKWEGFEWDFGNLEHIKKHDVSAKECEEAFFLKPILIKKDLAHSRKEDRFSFLGKTSKERKIFLVFTLRGNLVRIISARDQSKKERKIYRILEVKNKK